MNQNSFKCLAGKPYLPSNGTEGMNFTGRFCDNCIHQHPDPDSDHQCNNILLESLIGNQPKEWIYDSDGFGTCTAFKKWDWGNDKDGWNEPPEPEPISPNQLVFPFLIFDILEGFENVVVSQKGIIEKELIE